MEMHHKPFSQHPFGTISLRLILLCLGLTILSCGQPKEDVPASYMEHQTSFFDLHHGDWTQNTWVRQPENLLMLHESFKQFGYLKLLKQVNQSGGEFIVGGIYIKKNFQQWADSLERSYTDLENAGTYYQEFWQRRKTEGNDSVVYHIIQEFNALTTGGRFLPLHPERVNDTLVGLLQLELGTDTWDEARATMAFNRLKEYGMHQSAYNWLYERPETSGLSWNRDSLRQTLVVREADSLVFPWVMDLEP